MPASNEFVNTLKRIWESGDAAFPIDQRLPDMMKRGLVERFGASSVITADETSKISDGKPVESGDALVIATSGSSGEQKGAVHTHDSIEAAALATGAFLKCNASDHWLACISLAHVGGMSVITRALQFESALSISTSVSQEIIDKAVADGATLTSLVPTSVSSLNVSGFRQVLVGGSKPFRELPQNAVVTYGLTETFGGVVYNGDALDGVDVRLNSESEIEIMSRSLMRCYRNDPLADTFTSDGWFRTGDIGEFVESKLSVLGRRDELINTGGYKVWPKSVEQTVSSLESVADCAVAGIADEKWGSAVALWLVVAGNQKVSLDDIRNHVKKSMPDYCAPQKLFVVSQIPRTALGKVRMSELIAVVK